MRSWDEPIWPEDYHRTLRKHEEAVGRVEEAAMMYAEASDRTKSFWQHYLSTCRLEQQEVEARLRQFKQEVLYEPTPAVVDRMCRP